MRTLAVALRCPSCLVDGLREHVGGFACSRCGTAVELEDGVLDFLGGSDVRSHSQEAHYEHAVDEEWETRRPHGAPALHRWILEAKLRRALALAESDLGGASVVNVCSGSGMDAEFLARRGAEVTLVDTSHAALERARRRFASAGLALTAIRARAETLPFGGRSFDYAFVHDGLHHLDDPELGIREMARVARRGVIVLEPAAARLTTVAVGLGLAEEQEDAGNVVRRLAPPTVSAWLAEAGMATVRARRDLVVQRHVPTRAERALSRPALFPLARLVYGAAAEVPGRWVGNKLTVVGLRGAS